ncbi:hypothetical protein [Fulvivirga lutea]|uniref:Outer membrane protein beta-barrel domain-containing protein n=1 Tax=Fulvivirga lutea TaxID=2810512 RepID=A0A974WG26_9BACT|nr:hypothetical protein [Fulvivirga lutea]QSE97813.1 hypothetical protein JR347_01615 [Fulvivirga lutea]
MSAIRSCIVFFFLLTSILGKAQKTVNLGFHFNYFAASPAFKENITRNPLGTSLTLMLDKSDRLKYGVEVGFGLYSGKKYYYETVAEGFPDNYEYLYEENGFLQCLLTIRYQILQSKKLTPFIDVKGGTSTFFSVIRSMQVSEVYEDKFRFHDTTFNLGAGLGVSCDVGKIFKNEDWRRRLYFELSSNYIYGGKAGYRNSVRGEIVDSYEAGNRYSSTSTVQIKSGFLLAF